MKRFKLNMRIIYAVFILFVATPVLSAEAILLTSESDDYKKILNITRAYYSAWSYTKDDAAYDQAGRFYSKDPNNVYWDPLPPLQGHRGWDEYQNVIKKVWLPAGMIAAGILFSNDGSFQAWRFDDVIWTTANCLVHAEYRGGKSATMPCRGTQIWVEEEGSWLVAHEHFSAAVNPRGELYQGPRKSNEGLKTHAEFSQLSESLLASWSKGTAKSAGARLGPFYSDALPLRLYMPWAPHNGFQTWAAFEKGLNEYIGLTSKKISVTHHGDLEATQKGDIAWSTATVHFDFEQHDASHVFADGRQTLIWIKHKDTWRVIHEHLSIPMGK